MIRCRSCLLDCLRAVIPEAPNPRLPRFAYATARTYATAVVRRGDQYNFSENARFERRQKVVHERGPPPNFIPKLDKEISDNEKRYLKRELVYLQDPLKLAGQVRTTLAKHEFDKALAMTRMASKEMQCTVAWNHIIDYLMSRGATKAALKVYNEMKKRAVFPDSHTIVLILRGMATGKPKAEDVSQAVTMYHSLSAPNSRVQKSIIHTNATLQVCAKAGDIDSLWSVVGSIPDSGREAADTLTFTVILNALRENAIVTANYFDKRARTIALERAVQDGKRIWEDIVGKWREGKLRVDEGLVCAMGRLLLIGERPRDWDDVLSLMEQTMNVPRLAPRVGSEDRHTEHLLESKIIERGEAREREFDDELSATGNEVFNLKAPASSVSGLFATPGRNTLSVILESCNKMRSARLANEYWAFLTDRTQRGAIVPDLDNYHSLFRILRTSRSSARAVELLGQISNADTPVDQIPRNTTFLLVMSTCVRDKNNPNVMEHAGRVIDYMERCLPDVIVRPLAMYLDLAKYTNKPEAVTRAYVRMAPLVKNVISDMAPRAAPSQKESNVTHEVQEVDLMALVQSMIGCIDAMINRGIVAAPHESQMWAQRRTALAAYITRKKTMVQRKGRPESILLEPEGLNASKARSSQSASKSGKTSVDDDIQAAEHKDEEDKRQTVAPGTFPEDNPKEMHPPVSTEPRRQPNPPARSKVGVGKLQHKPRMRGGLNNSERYLAERKREDRRGARQLRHFRRNEAVKMNRTIAAADALDLREPRPTKSRGRSGGNDFADFAVEVDDGRFAAGQRAGP
ncbi:hypothetical protein MBLNU457_5807t1 [Dothideomycetes sp. NU457]